MPKLSPKSAQRGSGSPALGRRHRFAGRRGNQGIAAQEQFQPTFIFNPFQDATARLGDHVYAFQTAGLPVCIELKTGKLAWGPIRTALQSRAALTCADGRLSVRGANGLMPLVEATPTAYVEKGSFQIPNREEASGVTSPVVVGGRRYLRDNDRLPCYDIAADAFTRPRIEPKTVSLALTRVESQTGESANARPRLGKDRAPDAIHVPTPEDIFTLDLSDADVIAVYLPSPLMRRLIPQFEKLKPGSRIVSHQFDLPGIRPEKQETVLSKEDGDRHRLFLWTMPLKKGL